MGSRTMWETRSRRSGCGVSKFPEIACVTRPVPHQVKAMAPIAAELRRRGYRVRETYDRLPPDEIVFCWGWGWAKEIRAKFPNTIVCCLDHGFFHPRKETVMTGWQGLNGFGEHPLVDDPSRLNASPYLGNLKPWRKNPPKGDRLILGQVYQDAQITDTLEDYGRWLQDRAKELEPLGGRLVFRQHPVQARRGEPDTPYGNIGTRSGNPSIYADFDTASTVLAMNSNGLLDAFLYGVVDVRLYNKGSMLWPICQEIDGYRQPRVTLRQRLAERLAWCQWHPDEIKDGQWVRLYEPIMRRIYETGQHTPWWATGETYDGYR